MATSSSEAADVVVIGGGPAGMQVALVIARTRKHVVVFDDPEPPRNAASHGVHGVLGLDGLKPDAIREIAWKQIDVYDSAELRSERVTNVERVEPDCFVVTGADGSRVSTKKLVLAFGYHDAYANLEGFSECWADTIIPCPFCDGYENRDRKWGVVPRVERDLEVFPKMAQNWASSVSVFLPPRFEIAKSYRDELEATGISVHEGRITALHQRDGKLQAVTLDSGSRHEVETLLWTPDERPSPLVEVLRSNLSLEVEDEGYIKTNESFATNVPGVWAVGDVKGWSGGLGSAAAGNMAAIMIVQGWFP